ncbi:hypothetical protein FOZ76_14795 [Verticiella sediminum]|uniref:Zn-ribbon domain-containing OB-fold protein n=1 Tax=Verticiella sediminum TaxID=1247510 RepID=A0A556AII2_9BURK|nr:OB-fold domain-containing protein [Verticiella sediminum]TSH92681.1 hypothetical protein FOZ76_14795 [Verticiella sediminum]
MSDSTSSEPVAAAKPLPVPSELARPFWQALKHHELRLQQCTACHFYNHPPRIACPRCHGHGFAWTRVRPQGSVYSYTVVHRPPVPAFKEDVPYAVALVDVADTNVRLLSNLLAPLGDLRIGMPVEIVFDDVTPDISLFRFRPCDAAAPSASTAGRP